MFKDIIGQEEIKQHLIQSAREGRIPHAQLFTGVEGNGKLALAVAYCQYIACEHPKEHDSCGECPSCLKFKQLQHPDLHFVYPIVRSGSGKEMCGDFLGRFREALAGNPYMTGNQWLSTINSDKKKGKIYDDESDIIIGTLSKKAYEGGYKFMIIWQPEMMGELSSNKILKLIEEPPARTLMILVTSNQNSIIGTILSRTQRVAVPPIDTDSLYKYLYDNCKYLSEEDAKYISRSARGSVSAALELADVTSESKQFFEDFAFLMRVTWKIRHLPTKDEKCEALLELKAFAERIAKQSRNSQLDFLRYAQRMVRENFIYNFHNTELNYMASYENEFSVKFSPFINEANVIHIANSLSEAENAIFQNGQAKIIFVDLCLKMIAYFK